MRDIDGYLGELGREMKGVAEYWNVDLGIVVGLNLIYELRRVRVEILLANNTVISVSVHSQLGGGRPNTTNGTTAEPSLLFGCTSIVTQDEQGNVFHGRNLDWNLPNELRNLSVQVC